MERDRWDEEDAGRELRRKMDAESRPDIRTALAMRALRDAYVEGQREMRARAGRWCCEDCAPIVKNLLYIDALPIKAHPPPEPGETPTRDEVEEAIASVRAPINEQHAGEGESDRNGGAAAREVGTSRPPPSPAPTHCPDCGEPHGAVCPAKARAQAMADAAALAARTRAVILYAGGLPEAILALAPAPSGSVVLSVDAFSDLCDQANYAPEWARDRHGDALALPEVVAILDRLRAAILAQGGEKDGL